MKIRTINGAAEELKALDPGTQITAWTIRKMITDGTLPYSADAAGADRMPGRPWVYPLRGAGAALEKCASVRPVEP